MIYVDANLLIYAVNADAPLHRQARTWVQDTLDGQRGPVALSWFSRVAFVRIILKRSAVLRTPKAI